MLKRDDAPGRCHRDIREEIGAAWMTHEIWKLLKSSVISGRAKNMKLKDKEPKLPHQIYRWNRLHHHLLRFVHLSEPHPVTTQWYVIVAEALVTLLWPWIHRGSLPHVQNVNADVGVE